MSVSHRWCPRTLRQSLHALAPSQPMSRQNIQSIRKINVWNIKVKNAVILSKIIFLCAKSHMHISNMLVIYLQSFKLNAWKLWQRLITQSCYPILKPNLKIFWVENAVILSKIICASARSYMLIFSVLVTSVQSFNLLAWKLWEELITQTYYPMKPNLKIVLVENAIISSKIIFRLRKVACTCSICLQHLSKML